MRYRRRWCSIASLTGTIAASAACFGDPAVGGTGATTASSSQASTVGVPPAPAFGGADTADRSAVLTYARGASYVTDSRLVDEQVLHLPAGTGPRARIQATAYSHMLTDSQLARGALIARFVSEGAYTPLGLNRGVQYFFVDSVAGAGWRAIIVDNDPARAPKVMKLVLADTPHDHSVPSARWMEAVSYTFANPSCGKYCCIPCDDVRGYSCPTGPWPPQIPIDEVLDPAIRPGTPGRPGSPPR
jgi:hypothetical protein